MAKAILRPLEVRFGLTSASKISIAKAPSKFEYTNDGDKPRASGQSETDASGNSVDEDILDFLHD